MDGKMLYEKIYQSPPWEILPSNEIADWNEFADKFISRYADQVNQDELAELLQEQYEIGFIDNHKLEKNYGIVFLAEYWNLFLKEKNDVTYME